MNFLRSLVVGAVPPAAGLTLAHVNAILGLVSLALGIAFTVWNWTRLAREDAAKRAATFPVSALK